MIWWCGNIFRKRFLAEKSSRNFMGLIWRFGCKNTREIFRYGKRNLEKQYFLDPISYFVSNYGIKSS
ncbi:hypothetical protein MNBD_ALPHA11-2257 [hydrothermal vent metagenome]|uniref:Uncharacterized protein n=1 Tax=hydrothermal vent metagenome TaxID=652676 RepID=A0A3B0TJK5_9ZZZZ